jgi:hypothetical protein
MSSIMAKKPKSEPKVKVATDATNPANDSEGDNKLWTSWKLNKQTAGILRKISAITGHNQQDTLQLFIRTFEDYYYTLIQREVQEHKKA